VKKIFAVLLAVPMSLALTEANAALVTITATGTVVSGTDTTGVFGSIGADLANDVFSMTFHFDTDVGVIINSSTRLDLGGGSHTNTVSPSLGASFQIGSQSVSFAGNYASALDIAPSGSDSQYFLAYVEDGPSKEMLLLTHSLVSDTGLPASLTPFSVDVDPYISSVKLDDWLAYLDVDHISLSVDSAPTVTPLPATLPFLATGLGALGLFGWRKKRSSNVAA